MNTQESSQSGIIPRFYMGAKQSARLTEEKGRPVFVDVEMIEILIAGDSKTVVIKKVNEEHKQRWPQHYEAFKKGLEPPTDGLPLKHCPLFTVAQVATMNASKIYTVEALAELPDSFLTRLGMGARGWQAKAKAYLKTAEGTARDTKLAAENARMQSEIDALKAQIQRMLEASGNDSAPAVTMVEKVAQAEEPQVAMPKTFEDLKLSSRTKTALTKSGVTMESLMKMTPEEVANIPGIGIGGVAEITELFE